MIAITIDCEQWNAFELRNKKEEDIYHNSTLFSFKGNKRLLDIFQKNQISATFFITGFFAEKHEQQVREIAKSHEIGCHGYNHFYRGNTNLNLREDIVKAKKILEKILNKNIVGFRAAQMQSSEKLIEVLTKLGFKYDSSSNSAYIPFLYGKKEYKDNPLKPFEIYNETLKNKLIEIPASASYKFRFPFHWIFMRNLPLIYTIKIVEGLLKKNIPVVLYVHSWEFYPIKKGPVPGYVRNTGDKFARKLDKFIKYFKNKGVEFVRMNELVS